MKTKGFTLIELLLVVAIIAMLTSVVMALIGTERDKARVRAFRREIEEMVNAIELYRADNGGRIPGFGTSIPYSYTKNESNTAGAVSGSTQINLEAILSSATNPYLREVPAPPFDGEMAFVKTPNYRCNGAVAAPEYQIWVTGTKNLEYFNDWSVLESTGGVEVAGVKCFAIK
jgi:prepilin-type N-terminal cleavage/methylation domain-containing protein